MRKRQKTMDSVLRSDVSESGDNASRPGQVISMPDPHMSLDQVMPDKDRATLLHIDASVSALIRNADEHRMIRLGHLLRLVKSETQVLLDRKDIEKR